MIFDQGKPQITVFEKNLSKFQSFYSYLGHVPEEKCAFLEEFFKKKTSLLPIPSLLFFPPKKSPRNSYHFYHFDKIREPPNSTIAIQAY